MLFWQVDMLGRVAGKLPADSLLKGVVNDVLTVPDGLRV